MPRTPSPGLHPHTARRAIGRANTEQAPYCWECHCLQGRPGAQLGWTPVQGPRDLTAGWASVQIILLLSSSGQRSGTRHCLRCHLRKQKQEWSPWAEYLLSHGQVTAVVYWLGSQTPWLQQLRIRMTTGQCYTRARRWPGALAMMLQGHRGKRLGGRQAGKVQCGLAVPCTVTINS